MALVSILSLGLPACRQELPVAGQPLEKTPAQARNSEALVLNPLPFPGPPLFSSEQMDRIRSARSITDLFQVVSFVKLEATDRSIITEVTAVVRIGGSLFVLDYGQNLIFQFSLEGKFIKTVGRVGQGPGEYTRPGHIYRCLGDKLAMEDGGSGNLHIFDADGQFLRTISVSNGSRRMPFGARSIWDSPETLYLADLPSRNVGDPAHAIFKFEDDRFVYVAGFGHRFAPLQPWVALGGIHRRYACFAKVGPRIWTGSPYLGYLEIFDEQGQELGELHRPYPNLLMEEKDYENVNFTDPKQLDPFPEKFRNNQIIPAGKLVLASMFGDRHFVLDVFDANGNLLVTRIQDFAPFLFLRTFTDGELIGVLFPLDSPETYRKALSEEEMSLLEQAGWRAENYLEDNPYLAIGRPLFQ